MTDRPADLVLASSSRFRAALLQRLDVPFRAHAPDIDESPLPGEAPIELVTRLASTKAEALADLYPDALIIGSDQVAATGQRILGKPGDLDNAREQLKTLSGRSVDFFTGLCVFNPRSGQRQVEQVPYRVYFRDLSGAQIDNYLRRERPFDCAGSFRSEGLGIALIQRMQGEDPTALIGLPLVRLVSMLAVAGYDVLGES